MSVEQIVKRKPRKLISEKDYEREKQRVLKRLEEMALFDDVEAAKEVRTERASEDFWYFCHTYLPHYFSSATQAEFHNEMVETLTTVKEQVIAIAAPRGFSKSTICSFAIPLWWILTEQTRFTVINMDTQPKAEMQTWRILLELQLNERIKHDFGSIVSDEAARGDFRTIVTETRRHSIRLLAFSAGMSARGLINAQFRPDKWINDDIEDRRAARNPKRAERNDDILYGDNLGAMCAEGWTFAIVGTVICRKSVMDNAMKNAAFIRLKYRAIERDENGVERSTWPEVHPLKMLLVLKATMGRARFSAEKQNEPVDKGMIFDEAWFVHWAELPPDLDLSHVVIQLDPSYSDVGDNKAMFAMTNYAVTPENIALWRDADGTIFPEGEYTIILDVFNRKCSIDDMILEVYKWYARHKPFRICCDGTYAQKIIYKREFGRYEATRGRLPIKFTIETERKTDRILRLEPDIQRGYIVFPVRNTEDVEETIVQFTRFGETDVNDDGPDAIEAGTRSLKKINKKARVMLIGR